MSSTPSKIHRILIDAALRPDSTPSLIEQALRIANEEETVRILTAAQLTYEQMSYWLASRNYKHRKAIAGRRSLPVQMHRDLVAKEKNGQVLAAALRHHTLDAERIDELAASGKQTAMDALLRNATTQKIAEHPQAAVHVILWAVKHQSQLVTEQTEQLRNIFADLTSDSLQALKPHLYKLHTYEHYWTLLGNVNINDDQEILRTWITKFEHLSTPGGHCSRVLGRWIKSTLSTDWQAEPETVQMLEQIRDACLNEPGDAVAAQSAQDAELLMKSPQERHKQLNSTAVLTGSRLPQDPQSINYASRTIALETQVAHLLSNGHTPRDIWNGTKEHNSHQRAALVEALAEHALPDDLIICMLNAPEEQVSRAQGLRRTLQRLSANYQPGHTWPQQCLAGINKGAAADETIAMLKLTGTDPLSAARSVLRLAVDTQTDDDGYRLREMVTLIHRGEVDVQLIFDIPVTVIVSVDHRAWGITLAQEIEKLAQLHGEHIVGAVEAMWDSWSGTVRELLDTISAAHEIIHDNATSIAATGIHREAGDLDDPASRPVRTIPSSRSRSHAEASHEH